MIEVESISFETVKDIQKGFILCPPDKKEEVIKVIKQWIAHTMTKYYFGVPKTMIEAKEHILQFQCINWLDKIIIIHNK